MSKKNVQYIETILDNIKDKPIDDKERESDLYFLIRYFEAKITRSVELKGND